MKSHLIGQFARKDSTKDIMLLGYKILLKLIGLIFSQSEIYSKGSFNQPSRFTLLSDLDLIIVSENKERICKKAWWFRYFRIDYDVYTVKEFSHLKKYGGFDFLEGNIIPRNSKAKKKGFQNEYVFYPLKYYIDIINKLFFHLEWASKQHNKNRNRELQRTFQKINLLLKRINCEPIIEVELPQFLKKLSNLKQLQKIQKIFCAFPIDLEDDYTETFIEGEQFLSFKEGSKIQLLDSKIYIANLYLPRQLFSLFKLSGCLSLDYLLQMHKGSRNYLGRKFATIAFCSYRLQGKYSWLKRNKNNQELLNWIIKSQDLAKLEKFYPTDISQVNLISKTIYITVSWGQDHSRNKSFALAKEKLTLQSKDTFHLHINFSEHDYHSDALYVINLKPSRENFSIWHKEGLLNLAGYFSLFADQLIFADNDIYSDDQDWINKICHKLEANDFVQGFSFVRDTLDADYNAFSWTKMYKADQEYYRAPGLIWATTPQTFLKIDGLPDDFPEGSGDGALVRELTGVKLSFIDQFHWFNKNLRNFQNQFSFDYVDVEVVHVNHGRARDYVNRSIFLELIHFPIESVINKDSFGLLAWKSENEYLRRPFELKDLIFEMDQDKFIFSMKELMEKNILKSRFDTRYYFYTESPHYEEIVTDRGELALLFKESQDCFRLYFFEKYMGVDFSLSFLNLKHSGAVEQVIFDLENTLRVKGLVVNTNEQVHKLNFFKKISLSAKQFKLIHYQQEEINYKVTLEYFGDITNNDIILNTEHQKYRYEPLDGVDLKDKKSLESQSYQKLPISPGKYRCHYEGKLYLLSKVNEDLVLYIAHPEIIMDLHHETYYYLDESSNVDILFEQIEANLFLEDLV